MLFPGIFPEAVERFRRPPTDLINIGVLLERGLLYLEHGGEISFGRWADVNHTRSSLMCLKRVNVRISKPGRIFYLLQLWIRNPGREAATYVQLSTQHVRASLRPPGG